MCRKKAGLEPTGQIKSIAAEAGFNNAHDYLVHLVTGESGPVIAARKTTAHWGAWLLGGSTPPSPNVAAETEKVDLCVNDSHADGDQDTVVGAKKVGPISCFKPTWSVNASAKLKYIF